MPDHEKEKLLREVEKGLMHSREITCQIDKILAQRSRLPLIARTQWRLSIESNQHRIRAAMMMSDQIEHRQATLVGDNDFAVEQE